MDNFLIHLTYWACLILGSVAISQFIVLPWSLLLGWNEVSKLIATILFCGAWGWFYNDIVRSVTRFDYFIWIRSK